MVDDLVVDGHLEGVVRVHHQAVKVGPLVLKVRFRELFYKVILCEMRTGQQAYEKAFARQMI